MVITGWNRGDNQTQDQVQITFGIESYFVQEGTDLQMEYSAEYGIVKISKDGNKIPVGVE